MVGTILHERYEILSEIGNGGMATVYLAYCNVLKRKVAIKVLKYSDDIENENSLITEAKAIARVNHANIVQIYDIFEDDNKTYIVMEFVNGDTLKAYLKENPNLGEEEIISLSTRLASALNNAHMNGVIHRDIKPDNILLDTQHQPKITDFGIAHVSNENTIVRGDQVFGSLRYASPEQLKGNVIDERSDIYSLGVVMYEMATGTMPFPDESPVTAAFRKLKEPLPKVSTINPEISEKLSDLILKATQIDSNLRYNSMQDFYNALIAIDKDKVVEPVMPVKQTTTTPKYVSPNSEKKSNPSRKAVVEEKQSSWKPILLGALFALLIGGIVIMAIIGSGNEVVAVDDPTVPDVVGKTTEEAMAILNKAGFYASVVKVETSNDIDKGKVITQQEKAKTTLKRGSTIHLTVSAGSQKVLVPSFINKTRNEALTIANDSNINITFKDEFHESVEDGLVFDQSIQEGEKVEPNTTVELSISTGPEVQTIKVPDITGESYKTALTMLETKDLQIGTVEYEYSDEVPEGRIIKQTPSADEEIEENSTVDIVISKGKEPVVEPDPPVESETTESKPIAMKKMKVQMVTDWIVKEEFLVTAEYIEGGKTVEVYSKKHSNNEELIEFTFEAPGGSQWKVRVDGRTSQEGTVPK